MPRGLSLIVISLIILIILCPNLVVASETHEMRSIKAVRASQPPKVDGKLDDLCWQDAPSSTDFVDPYFADRVIDQTVIFILYDDENIYIACYCYDSQPEKIIARETKRDGGLWHDDCVSISIDPFHTHQYSSQFSVNAIGTQSCYIAGGRASKTEWKGDWQGAASKASDGWIAEMAIPFAILNYPSIDTPATIGINFARRQVRNDIYSIWSNIGMPERPERAGHLEGIVFPKKQFRRKLSVMTYAFGGIESNEGEIDTTLHAGLNAKYPITSEMTAVASINPDFSNVEQQVESIDFSYRERYYPDWRPFFQEGGGIIGSGSWGFYSRRIPHFDFGLKTYGKIGRTSIGVLDCIDLSNASEMDEDPINRNDLVISTRFDLGESSTIPVQYIRMDDQELWNHAFACRPEFRWKDLSFGGAIEGSQTEGGKSGGDYFAHVGWNSKHFHSSIFGYYVTPDFEIINGLVPFTDSKGGGFDVGYGTEWQTGFLKNAGCGINMSRADRLDGKHYENNVGAHIRAHLRSDFATSLKFSKGRYEEYRDWTLSGNLTGNVENKYRRYGISISYGRREDADYTFLSPYISYRFIEKLSMGLSSEILWHKEDRQLYILTLNYDITPEKGVGVRLVHRDKDLNAFITYRQAVRRGIDMFIIIGDPNSSKMHKRVLAKVIVPL